MPAFTKLLIANRGEIACRIHRSAAALGYRTVAVYSEADAGAPHARLADEAVCIGPAPASESYLSIQRLIEAARRTGANAVHPGYGFLAENADFAEACAAAGLAFVGPPVAAIRAMGDKRAAKALMRRAGVPCLPGYDGEAQDDATLLAEARRIRLPLMIKAAAGGGGRGMRLVRNAERIGEALVAARAEAESAFGSGALLLERAVADGRHVEIQVMADRHGSVVHLGERDCSVQRRHQKVVEEAPSPAVDPALRARMGAAAVAAARAVDYVGAGTVEFLLEADGSFHFLEMNTRLQVEHPVTELVTGLDIVALQLRVAAGEPLPFAQEDIRVAGHAIEVRLYAEDAAAGFLPQTGRVLAWESAAGAGVRVDHGLAAGRDVTAWYDPMLAKLVAHGRTREEARRRLVRALEDTLVLGPVTNRDFLLAVLRSERFAAGAATTGFVEAEFPEGFARPPASPEALALAALLLSGEREHADGWRSTGAAAWPIRLGLGEETVDAEVVRTRDGDRVTLMARTVDVRILARDGARLRVEIDGIERNAAAALAAGEVHLDLAGQGLVARERSFARAAAGAEAGGALTAPMSGRVVRVLARVGDAVRRGETVVVVEAMKMQHEVRAGAAGRVERIAVAEGDQVASRQLLATIAAGA